MVNQISLPLSLPIPLCAFFFGQISTHFWHWKHSPFTDQLPASGRVKSAGQQRVQAEHPFAHCSCFLRTEKTGTMCKRVFCLYTLLSSRFNPSGSRQLVCKWRVFSVSKMRGYLPEEECTQRNWQAERQWNLVYHFACSCSGCGSGISRYLKKPIIRISISFFAVRFTAFVEKREEWKSTWLFIMHVIYCIWLKLSTTEQKVSGC